MVRIHLPHGSEPTNHTASGATTRRTAADGGEPEPLVWPYTIQFDRRERQGGWNFHGITGGSKQKYRPLIIPTQEIHMVTADYTADGFPVYIERKSHPDFLGSISGGHGNLEAEFERMQSLNAAGGHCCMVVESSLDRLIDDLESPGCMRKVTPAAVLGIVASWPMRFGVPIHFAGTRRLAELLAFRIICKFIEKTLEESKHVERN